MYTKVSDIKKYAAKVGSQSLPVILLSRLTLDAPLFDDPSSLQRIYSAFGF